MTSADRALDLIEARMDATRADHVGLYSDLARDLAHIALDAARRVSGEAEFRRARRLYLLRRACEPGRWAL